MSRELRIAFENMSANIKRNLPRIERKLSRAGVPNNGPTVYSAAKYYETLNKLAKE